MSGHATGATDPSHHGNTHHHHRPHHKQHKTGSTNRSSPRHESGSIRSSDSDDKLSVSSDNTHEVLMEIEDPSVIRIGIIADNEVTLGFLLAGIGYHRDRFRNYLMVENDMPLEEIEHFFHNLYRRQNISIILLDFLTSRRLHSVLETCNEMLPVIVIIPTKVSIIPYLEEKERLRRQRQRELYQ